MWAVLGEPTGLPRGRESEIVQLEAFLSGLITTSAVLRVEGEAGIGKTTLLRYVIEIARERGFLVLEARPTESEMPLEFSTLSDMLEGLPSTVLERLPEPQRLAIAAAVQRTATADTPIDSRTIAAAVLTAVRSVSAANPVLMIVDDLPWADAPSRRVIAHVMRRLRAPGVGLLVGIRTEWMNWSPASTLSALGLDEAQSIAIGPIAVEDVRAVVGPDPGIAFTPARIRRLHSESGGNPMMIREIARRERLGDPARSQSSGRYGSLRGMVIERVRALSLRQREALLTVALSTSPTLDLLGEALTDGDRANEHVDEGVRDGTFAVAGERIHFSHPLIRSTIVDEASLRARRSAHLRLAAAVGTQEESARHLALAATGPDSNIAAQLEIAAVTAGRRGACETAAELADLAVKLTPPGENADRFERIALQAEYRFDCSEPLLAQQLLQQVIDAIDPGPRRAEFLRRRGTYGFFNDWTIGQWTASLLQSLDESGPDEVVRCEVLRDLALACVHSGAYAQATRYGCMALSLAETVRDQSLVAQACALTAWADFCGGGGVRTDLISRVDPEACMPERLNTQVRPRVLIGHVLRLSDDLDGARVHYTREYEQAKEEGIVTGLPTLIYHMVETEILAGNWSRAEDLTAEEWQISHDTESEPALASMHESRAMVHAARGRVAAAIADVEAATRIVTGKGVSWFELLALHTIGVAMLSVGNYLELHQRIGVSVNDLVREGLKEPSMVRAVLDDAETLVRLGSLSEAAVRLDAFEARARELDRQSAIAGAEQCRGLLMAARGEHENSELLVDLAVSRWRTLPFPFELGRSLLIAGEIHRRARKRGRAAECIAEACAIFMALGATAWEQTARDEAARLGSRAPERVTDKALTAAERQVVELVGQGMTNAQVASQLFMGVRTVESHLSHVYRKMDVSSRTAMIRALGSQASSIRSD